MPLLVRGDHRVDADVESLEHRGEKVGALGIGDVVVLIAVDTDDPQRPGFGARATVAASITPMPEPPAGTKMTSTPCSYMAVASRRAISGLT